MTSRQLLCHQGGIRHYRDGERPMTRRFATLEDGLDLFTPPPDEARGVRFWLTLPEGQSLMELSEADRERLRALGYIQ